MSQRGILRRDRNTCQNCGAPNANQVVALRTPDSSPFNESMRMTACRTCARNMPEQYAHVPLLKHLTEHNFTVANNHPYLQALIWAAVSPMVPNPHLSANATTVLKSLKYVKDSIPTHIARSYNLHLGQAEYYLALDELKRHGYLLYNPEKADHLYRLDVYTPPPITADCAPLSASPRVLQRVREHPEKLDEPALLPARLYHRAGFTLSTVQLRRFLRHHLPPDAAEVHGIILQKLLQYMAVIHRQKGGGWQFTRNFRQYTNRQLTHYLEQLFSYPWRFVMPSDEKLAQGAKPYVRRHRDVPRRPAAPGSNGQVAQGGKTDSSTKQPIEQKPDHATGDPSARGKTTTT